MDSSGYLELMILFPLTTARSLLGLTGSRSTSHFLSKFWTCFLLGSFLCQGPFGTSAERLCEEFGQAAKTEIEPLKTCNLCFALWKPSNDSGEITFIQQGCWEASPVEDCGQDECIATSKLSDKASEPGKERTHFCCCASDFCNGNVSVIEIMGEDEDNDMKDHLDGITRAEMNSPPDSLKTPIAALIAIIIGVVFALAIFVGVYLAWKNRDDKFRSNDADDLEAGEKLMEPLFKEVSWEITDPIVLDEEIAKGKFATVYSGKTGGMDAALKVFSSDQREFFENEKFIFHCLGKINLANIVKYHGWQESSGESSQSLILVLDRIRPGNLRDFLAATEVAPLPLPSIIKIMRGIASGLSYLHGENKDEIVIAHRDLTSKNILIDLDLNCYVSDFGLSLLTRGSKYYFAGRERQAEFCSLAEAGTLRYMAPELLEGAVNLKDCENALKQADVYALALILWEVSNLSFDIALQPAHHLPYEQEIGKDICIETLARYVVSRRDRPSFSGWRDSSISRSLRDTLNESWDPEPDARLTTLCIVERLSDLLHSKNIVAGDSTTPLEAPPTSPWTGRNPCLQRNLLEENSEDKSTEYLVTSEKHLIPAGTTTVPSRIVFMGNSGASISSSSDQSFSGAATTNTDLSSSSAQTHPLHLPVPPNPIPFVQNIRR